jgi:D-galactarolactone cycloisomerase
VRITRVDCHILRVPLGEKTFYSSQAAFPERNSFLVSIHTDAGLTGWGEGGQYGPAEPLAACVEHVLAPRVLDRDPTEPVRINEELYAFSRDFGQKGTYVEAISALDIALWDLAGKAAGLPVAKLLGGAFRSRVAAYATGCYYPTRFDDLPAQLEALKAEASSYVGSGFPALKVKIGLLDPADDLARLATIRKAIGPDIKILVDANHGYNAATATRVAQAMEGLGVLWFEEPVVPEDREGYRLVRSKTTIPIAGGEAEFTRYGFRDFIAGGCADIVQPDIACCGGFSEFVKILALATSHNVATIPHVWGSGIAVAAALQAIATIPPFPHTANPLPLVNAPMVEFDRTPNPLRDDLLVQPFVLEGGTVAIPSRPGLGVEVRPDVLARYGGARVMEGAA